MYGGLLTTTSTVPARSSKAVGEVAEPQVDAGAGQVDRRVAVGALVHLDRVHPRAGHLVGDAPSRWRPSRCRGRRPPARRDALACSTAQPASSSVSGRGTKTPGPTTSSTWRKWALPVRCCSGSRAARRATRASYAAASLGRRRRRRARAGRGRCRARGPAASRRRPRGLATPASARRRTASASEVAAPHGVTHGPTAASRASRSASTAESRTGWRSPSSTASRL